MQIKFNKSFKSLKNLTFSTEEPIKIKNTTSDIKRFCSCSPNLQFVNGGKILNPDISYMFSNDSKLSSVSSDFNGVVQSIGSFENCRSMSSIEANCKNLSVACDKTTFVDKNVGHGMFKNCTSLVSAELGELQNLTNGTQMFSMCAKMPSFSANTDKLVYASGMFYGCTNLTSCTIGSLKALKRAKSMFSNSGIKSFSAETESIEDARYMFSKCEGLEECDIDISDIQQSGTTGMFDGCTGLRRLSVGTLGTNLDLSSCPLTLKSVSGIASNAQSGQHTIYISDYTKQLSGFQNVSKIFNDKGWTIK